MKILCVIDNLNTGGAQRQIINLARAYISAAMQFRYFAMPPAHCSPTTSRKRESPSALYRRSPVFR